jgi:hypothetical protein
MLQNLTRIFRPWKIKVDPDIALDIKLHVIKYDPMTMNIPWFDLGNGRN